MAVQDVTISSDPSSIVEINLFTVLICAYILIGHLLEENRWMNESITALIMGLCSGGLILLVTSGKKSHLIVFSENLFFTYLLPPIIFNAGFQVKKKQFFRNFFTITLFGAVGTLVSWAVISFGVAIFFELIDIGSFDIGDYLAIGAIFAATDSVCTLQVLNQDETPLLYSLVFGEGVVNDATAIVLFNAIENFKLSKFDHTIAWNFLGNFLYLFFASTFLGVAAGLLSAYIIKKLYIGRHSTDREVALMILMAYLSYMLAELCHLSGILTVFFCGIVMSHYTWYNVSGNSRITTKHSFGTLSFVAETLIFLYVGMDAMDTEKWRFVSDSPGKSIVTSSILLFLLSLGRAAFVFPLSFIVNLTKKNEHEKITIRQQIIIWWAGLMRGAVSIALAYNKFMSCGHTHVRANGIMITSTISVVLFSTVVFGLLTKPLIRFILPTSKNTTSCMSSDNGSQKLLSTPLLQTPLDSEQDMDNHGLLRSSSLRSLLTSPTRSVHRHWRKFDDSFMRPMFGGKGFVPKDPDPDPDSPTTETNVCFT